MTHKYTSRDRNCSYTEINICKILYAGSCDSPTIETFSSLKYMEHQNIEKLVASTSLELLFPKASTCTYRHVFCIRHFRPPFLKSTRS